MQTYADTLNSKNYTVKALREIAKRMGLKGYSKLRKADLANLIVMRIECDFEDAMIFDGRYLRVDEPADHDTITALVAEFATEAPVKAPESAVEAPGEPDGTEDEVSELVTAYHLMHGTWKRSRGDVAKRLLKRLINIRTQVKALGYNPIELRMGYSVS